MDTEKIVWQALLRAADCVSTGRPGEAAALLAQAGKAVTGHPDVHRAKQAFAARAAGFLSPEDAAWEDEIFGRDWDGESLAGQSIQVIADQGMGDTIQLLRYVKLLKERGAARVVLNCYAYYDQFERLLRRAPHVDRLTASHERCDYRVNLAAVPAVVRGLTREYRYPTRFADLLMLGPPPLPAFGPVTSRLRPEGFKVGLAWQSNPDNPLAAKKSIGLDSFVVLEDGRTELFSLLPDSGRANFLAQLPIADLEDTAAVIAGCDAVVSVDTAVLHLAGWMGKATFGLLPRDADPRWGEGSHTLWYPSVRLFRQAQNRSWDPALRLVKEELARMRETR